MSPLDAGGASRPRRPGWRAAPRPLRAAEDAVEHDEELVLRCVARARSAARQRSIVAGVIVLERHRSPKAGSRCASMIRAVVAQRRRLAAAVVLGVAQELGGSVGERGAGADHARERAAARLVEVVAQPVLGQTLGEVAGGRPAALGPGRADLLLTWRPSGSRYFAYQTGPRARSTRKTWPLGLHSSPLTPQIVRPRDRFGTYSRVPRPETQTKKPRCAGLYSAPGEIRTPDLRFRRPTLYPAELRAPESAESSFRLPSGQAPGAGGARDGRSGATVKAIRVGTWTANMTSESVEDDQGAAAEVVAGGRRTDHPGDDQRRRAGPTWRRRRTASQAKSWSRASEQQVPGQQQHRATSSPIAGPSGTCRGRCAER